MCANRCFRGQNGFSLTEITVALAVSAVMLITTAPSINSVLENAAHSEAKIALTELYTAQQNFRAEYNTFHFNMPHIGYLPTSSIRRYTVGFTTSSCSVSDAASVDMEWIYHGMEGDTLGFPSEGVPSPPTHCPTAQLRTWGFVMAAVGVTKNTTPASPDTWTINHRKNIAHSTQNVND